ncbi:hypothetical protein DUI87_06340 [Hirundo rustica rustica]|uniref:ribonuclease H n=1 Tax=Hirundo rustica rustica TaxID=333673 RepID=A0A3M0KV10_HIRRU|nr:hypothetical protein DUI87_06340 [Hirundo rustica rustica]
MDAMAQLPLPAGLGAGTFPAKLWSLVNDPRVRSLRWDSEARGLLVDRSLFERELLRPGGAQGPAPHAFRATQFSSFVRQLYRYGFRKGFHGEQLLPPRWEGPRSRMQELYGEQPPPLDRELLWMQPCSFQQLHREQQSPASNPPAAAGTSAPHAPAGSAGCAASTASSSAQNAPAQEESPALDLGQEIEKMIREIRNSLPVKAPSAQGNINVAPESPREDPMNRAAAEEVSSGTESCRNSSPEPEEPGDKYHLEPVITLKVGPQGEELEFVVDTGAERTCLLHVPKSYSVSKDTAKVTGAKGETFTVPVIKDVVIEGETKIWVGDVLLVPKAGSNLLGRDLQVKLGIGVIPEDGKMTAKVLKLGQEDEEKINKEVWAGEGNRGGLNIDPISVTIEREDCPIRVRQYPISLEGREGLKPVIEGLIKDGTLEPCMSPHNTPILPVKKPDGSYRLVQDLREVNKRTRSRYPVVPNPYTLLSKVPPQHQWFSVVDLKDAFWACPLAKESRDIFVFEWEDPKTGRKQQLRWTKLPQGFTESPNLFGQALEKILQAFSTPPRIQIIQYVDDLLLSGEDEVVVREATIKLLNFLGEKGLRVSKGKLQFVEPEAVKFLYEKLTEGDNIKWTKEDDDKLEKLKLKLASIPALSLPSLEKPFHLYVNVEKGVAHGVLVQEWGGVKRPVAYLSKMLDPVSHGWPVCIQAIAATAILVEESRKLTFGGKLIVCTPHAVRNELNQKAEKWLTDSRMLKYEAILIDSDDLTLEVNRSLNPAQFLYGEPADNLIHNCLEIIQYQTKVRGDLEEQALSEGEIIYVDGSSRCLQGKRMSGYAVVDGKNMQTIEKGKLPSNWSAQTCELYAPKKALEYLAHKKGTIYTDSRYAFGVVHTFGKIWEERGLLNSRGKGLVHEGVILEILEALKLPEEIAIVHIKGHQKGVTPEIRGNNLADQEAKDAAENGAERVMLILTPNEEKLEIPKFSKAEKKELNKIGGEQAESGKWKLPDGRQLLNKILARKILEDMHQKTHWSTQALCNHFLRNYGCIGIFGVAKQVTEKCITCQKINKKVLLTTEAAIRTKERGWIHASRIKGPVEEPKEWTITSEPGDTKLTLKRGLGGNELGRPKWSKKHTQDHT